MVTSNPPPTTTCVWDQAPTGTTHPFFIYSDQATAVNWQGTKIYYLKNNTLKYTRYQLVKSFIKGISRDFLFQISLLFTLADVFAYFEIPSMYLFTKAVLQKWHIQCKRAKYLQFELPFFSGHKLIQKSVCRSKSCKS